MADETKSEALDLPNLAESRAATALGFDLLSLRNMYSPSRQFHVYKLLDDLGQKVPLHHRWNSLDPLFPKLFIRRALDLAINDALTVTMELEHLKQSDFNWNSISEKADDVHGAIKSFIELFTPREAQLSEDLIKVTLDGPATQLAPPVPLTPFLSNFLRGFEIANEPRRRVAKALVRDGGPPTESGEKLGNLANADLAKIIEVATLFRKMAAHANKFGEVKRTRKNPGAPGKMAFVRMMAKAWTCLTGTFPSQSEEFNRCDAFIRLAWDDATGQPFDAELNTSSLSAGRKRERSMASPFLHQIRSVAKELMAECPHATDFPLPFRVPDDL